MDAPVLLLVTRYSLDLIHPGRPRPSANPLIVNLDFAQSVGKARKTPFFEHLQEAIAPLFKVQYNLNRVLLPDDSYHDREVAYLSRGDRLYRVLIHD